MTYRCRMEVLLMGNVYRAALCDECVSKAKEEKKIIQKAEGVMW